MPNAKKLKKLTTNDQRLTTFLNSKFIIQNYPGSKLFPFLSDISINEMDLSGVKK